MKIVCIIPARGSSKGIPDKNLMPFCGKPLLQWTVRQANHSICRDNVYVSSDDERILSAAQEFGAEAIRRPDEIAGDTSPTEEALSNAINFVEAEQDYKIDVVVFLQATSPIRESSDIDKAVELFLNSKADSLFSGSVLDDFCVWKKYEDKLNSITFDFKNRGRRQDRDPYYLENGSIYVFKPEILKKHNNRLGGKIEFFPMSMWKSYEIDSHEDVDVCEYFMKKMLETR